MLTTRTNEYEALVKKCSIRLKDAYDDYCEKLIIMVI